VLGSGVRRACTWVDFLTRSGTRTGLMVAFEVDRFEWVDEHLVVSGRWYDLRGHRFVRPALTVEADEAGDDRRRMLADLEHKPWAADEGTDWIAAFPWDGEPVALARAELAVAPTVAVDLPLPRLPGRRRRPAPYTAPPRPAHRPPTPDQPSPAPAVRSEARAALAGGRDEVVAQRDALARERDAAIAERDTLAQQRDEAVAELDALARERDAAAAERDAAATERDALLRERDAAVRARAAAIAERDDARRAVAAAASERDRVDEARTALLRERDAARAARPEPPAAPSVRRPAAPQLRPQSLLALWGQRFAAVVALGVLAFVVYTLLEGVV
jgi:hypothetical protein